MSPLSIYIRQSKEGKRKLEAIHLLSQTHMINHTCYEIEISENLLTYPPCAIFCKGPTCLLKTLFFIFHSVPYSSQGTNFCPFNFSSNILPDVLLPKFPDFIKARLSLMIL